MVPHSWLQETMNLVGVAANIKNIIFSSMSLLKIILTANGVELREVQSKWYFFKVIPYAPLLFIIVQIPLTLTFNSTTCGHWMLKETSPVNHLLFMDLLKIYGRSEWELQSLVQTVHIIFNEIGMKFDDIEIKLELEMKLQWNWHWRYQVKQVEEDRCKYLGVILDNLIKAAVIKKKIEVHFRWVQTVSKSVFHMRHVATGINQWTLEVVRYSAWVVDWTQRDLRRIDVKTRKTLTSNGCLHPRACLYLKRTTGTRGLTSFKYCVLSECNGLWEYV